MGDDGDGKKKERKKLRNSCFRPDEAKKVEVEKTVFVVPDTHTPRLGNFALIEKRGPEKIIFLARGDVTSLNLLGRDGGGGGGRGGGGRGCNFARGEKKVGKHGQDLTQKERTKEGEAKG